MPRYEKRWVNGYWTTFDTHAYAPKWLHGLEKEVDEAVKRANARKPQRG